MSKGLSRWFPYAPPLLGERVLYLEQSRTGMAPYRQRLYVIERDGADDRAVSRVFELNTPTAYVGLCADPARETFTPDDVLERAGCAVHLTRMGDRFEGGTVEQSCESTLMGAAYATSVVVLRANSFSRVQRRGHAGVGRHRGPVPLRAPRTDRAVVRRRPLTRRRKRDQASHVSTLP